MTKQQRHLDVLRMSIDIVASLIILAVGLYLVMHNYHIIGIIILVWGILCLSFATYQSE